MEKTLETLKVSAAISEIEWYHWLCALIISYHHPTILSVEIRLDVGASFIWFIVQMFVSFSFVLENQNRIFWVGSVGTRSWKICSNSYANWIKMFHIFHAKSYKLNWNSTSFQVDSKIHTARHLIYSHVSFHSESLVIKVSDLFSDMFHSMGLPMNTIKYIYIPIIYLVAI